MDNDYNITCDSNQDQSNTDSHGNLVRNQKTKYQRYGNADQKCDYSRYDQNYR